MYYLQKIKSFISLLWRDLKNIWQDASILLKAIVIVAILFISIDLVLYFSKFHNGFSNTQGDWGTFGDFLGGTLNPIFGFFGFLALLATLSLQRKQLDEQRKDMEQQRKGAAAAYELQLQQIEAQRQEAAANQKALDEAHETQQLQQFESTFFNLFNSLLNEIKKINSEKYEYRATKHDLFRESIRTFKNGAATIYVYLVSLDEHINQQLNSNGRAHFSNICSFLRKAINNSTIYFRLLFHTIRFIELSDINNKNYYIDLIKDFLSNDIKLLLAIYICIIELDENLRQTSSLNYKNYIEKYSLLYGLKEYLIYQKFDETTELYERIFSFYAASAFEKPQPSAA